MGGLGCSQIEEVSTGASRGDWQQLFFSRPWREAEDNQQKHRSRVGSKTSVRESLHSNVCPNPAVRGMELYSKDRPLPRARGES